MLSGTAEEERTAAKRQKMDVEEGEMNVEPQAKHPQQTEAVESEVSQSVPAASRIDTRDELYRCDINERDRTFQKFRSELRADKLGQRYVSKVKVSGLAATKIMMHAKKGVDEGVAANGFPLEVMGLLFGYPADNGRTVVVTDAFEVRRCGHSLDGL